MASNGTSDRYIYNLPYQQHKELCRILDRDHKWEELGGEHMKFDMNTIHDLRRDDQHGMSPTEQLLIKWGQQNHTVVQLFVLLSKMHHYQAMLVLKPLVDSRYHPLIYEGEENLSSMFLRSKGKLSAPKGPEMKMSNNGSSPETAQLQVNGAPDSSANGASINQPSANAPLLDKNMNVGSRNLNVPGADHVATRDKVLFLVEEPAAREMSVVSDDHNDRVANDGASPAAVAGVAVDAAPAVQPPNSNLAANLQAENKENNIPAPSSQRKMSNASDASSVAELCHTIPQISYKELKLATNDWDKSTILGKGGFGTVFKGTWKNTLVAIKRIEQRGVESAESYQAQMKQSFRELHILNACRHDNILPLYGFSMDGTEPPCLVYQFMPNGSLEDRLLCRQGTKPLTWQQRHNIAKGTARGLQFLHNNVKPFIHGDIKSANILLDNNFEPRIGDFGLAREGPQSHYTHMKVSRVHGTRPYLPDEFLRAKQMSTKVDTYSFGIVLFELATGQRAYDETRPRKLLKYHVEMCHEDQLNTLCDPKAGPCSQEIFHHLIIVGKKCVSQRSQRPEMEEVLKRLESITSSQPVIEQPPYPVQKISVSPGNAFELQAMYDQLNHQCMMPSPNVQCGGAPGTTTPLALQIPINMNPEPNNMNVLQMRRNVTYGVPKYQPMHCTQISPSAHPGVAVQQNAIHLDANYVPRLNILRQETGSSNAPSSEDKLPPSQIREYNHAPFQALAGYNVNQAQVLSPGVANRNLLQQVNYPYTANTQLHNAASPCGEVQSILKTGSPQPVVVPLLLQASSCNSTTSLIPAMVLHRDSSSTTSGHSQSTDKAGAEVCRNQNSITDSGLPQITELGLKDTEPNEPIPVQNNSLSNAIPSEVKVTAISKPSSV